MPVSYEWKCEDCGVIVVVDRPMKDYRVAPNDACKCGSKEWSKLPASRTIVNGLLQKGAYNSGN